MSGFNRPRMVNDFNNTSKKPQKSRRSFYPDNYGLPYNIEREERAHNTARRSQALEERAQPRVDQAKEYDYSNRYVHTRLSPVGEVRNIQNPAEGYPKLQKLHQLKYAQTRKHVVKPYGCRVEPNQMIPTLNSWINDYKLQFDVIMIGALVENQFIQPLLCQLPLHRLCAKPGFLFIWATTQKIQELSKFLNSEECNKKFRRSEELVFVLVDKDSPYYPGNKSGVHNPNERPLFTQHQWHCWMCITGTVRRSTDNDLIHCNVDTDLHIEDQDTRSQPNALPDPIYRVTETFTNLNRRLHIIPSRIGYNVPVKLRPGWVIMSPDVLVNNFSPIHYQQELYNNSSIQYKVLNNSQRIQYLVPQTREIEELRPKSPTRN